MASLAKAAVGVILIGAAILASGVADHSGKANRPVPSHNIDRHPATGEEQIMRQMDMLIEREGSDWRRGK